ncbi:Snake venom vascular endothelial growth factor toxin vammin [Frankliniella fusca]|uniref:Snake venom vascular endothelial growth factor toxin vammin n=1 Tax=Frankliniella fusca TaxID=407009 RepID=A0AAE1HI04_9NEOP|nr:Snake venom vascular endothelial growth factor toxin vammin [Frankliniella fusca]
MDLRRPAPLLLLAAVVLVTCAVTALGCGPEPGSGSSRRRRDTDFVFPGHGHDELYEFNPFRKHLTLEQINALNDLETVEDMVNVLSNRSHDIESPVIARASVNLLVGPRIGGGHQGQARSPNVITPPQPKCQPRLQIVPLKPEDHISHIYLPRCVEIERCSGCCFDETRFSCQPTKTEQVAFRVKKYGWTDQKVSSEIVHVEKHLECRCGCIKQAKDCNALQEYDAKDCTCRCGQDDEKKKCKSFSNKRWDDESCKCICRGNVQECTTGLDFDPSTCMCTAAPQNRRRPDNTYKLDKRRRRWQNRTSDP